MTQPTPEYCRELLSYIPRLPYPEWIKAVAAVTNTFPYNVAHELLTSRWADEEPGETAYKMQDGVRLEKPDFGCLVNIAKEYGYTPKGNTNGANYAPPTPRPTPEPKPVSFADADPNTVLHNADGDRVFRLAVNLSPTVVNKTTDYTALTNNFLNVQLTISEIADVVKLGHAICPAQMIEGENRQIVRKSSNFKQSELIILDMDFGAMVNGEKVKDTANYWSLESFLDSPQAEPVALIYTSCSHTEEWNRYRVILPLPYGETNPERYQKVLKTFIDEYHADGACSDVCRPFFGNTKASIYNFITGETHHD